MSMEPCAAWRLRRFEKFFCCERSFRNVMCQYGLLKYHDPKTKKNKKLIKIQEKTGLFFSHKAYTSKPKSKVPATSTPALLLRVDDTKEDKHSDVQLDLLSTSRLFFSRFSILNVGSVLSKPFWFDSADSFLFLDGSVFDWKVVRVLMVVGLSSPLILPLPKSSFILFYSWCFCTPKAKSSIGRKPRVRFFECVFLYTSSDLKPE